MPVRYSLVVVCIALALAGILAYEYIAPGFDRPVTEEEVERRMVRHFVNRERERSLHESLQNLWARYPRTPRVPMSPAAVSAFVKQFLDAPAQLPRRRAGECLLCVGTSHRIQKIGTACPVLPTGVPMARPGRAGCVMRPTHAGTVPACRPTNPPVRHVPHARGDSPLPRRFPRSVDSSPGELDHPGRRPGRGPRRRARDAPAPRLMDLPSRLPAVALVATWGRDSKRTKTNGRQCLSVLRITIVKMAH